MVASISSSLLSPELATSARKRNSERWFQLALLPAALCAVYLLRAYGPSQLQTLFRPLQLGSPTGLIILFAAVMASIALHEGGHLLAALLLQFKLMGASLGPLRLYLLHGKYKVSFWRDWRPTASVSAAPRQLRNWRSSTIMVVIAGPSATLAGACVGAYLEHHSLLLNPLFAAAFVQVNALLFALSLIPNAGNARVRNDARLLLTLMSKGSAREELELSATLTILLLDGVRPQDHPRELMSKLANWRGRPEGELMFAEAMVRWALDTDEWALADKWDARACSLSERCSSRLRNHALASSACIDVLIRNDLETARSKFAEVQTGALFPECFEYRARAAEQIALGRNHSALPEVLRAQYSLPRGIAANELERKLLENLHLRALIPAESVNSQNLARSVSCYN